MTQPDFPPYPSTRLTRSDVVNYLVECQRKGWCQVYQKGAEFVLVIRDEKRIFLVDWEGAWHVVWELLGSRRKAGRANTLQELEQSISQAATFYGQQWGTMITSARIAAHTPATNIATVSKLVGSSEIQAVFDPYLDNAGLQTLADIVSFGGSISPNVRLLCSKGSPRLTKSYVDAWFRQLGVSAGEVRVMGKSEHRRFLLLSGGHSLLVGASLNSIAKNEAIRLEPDREDLPFFDSVWATAVPLV